MLEAFLNCIFGAEQPPSYRGRTAEPVCGGSTEVKVLHCMRPFLPAFHWVLMCICMCINSASKCRMKRVSEVCLCHLSINMSTVYVLVHLIYFSNNSTQNTAKIDCNEGYIVWYF